jgi:hypothetical protein
MQILGISGGLRRASFRSSLHSYAWKLPLAFFVLTAISAQLIAQQVSLPSVNLGDTSFLDGIANPGWVVEEIGQGVHDNKTLNSSGNLLPQTTDVNSGASLTHVAWLARKGPLGAWYGAEVVFSAAYVDTGEHGIGRGFGDVTFGPLILQWPKRMLFGMPIYQRVLLDIDAPLGEYHRDASVNIGNNAWDIHPYYAFTLFPIKRLETSWRIHYLWDGTNSAPPISEGLKSTQAGQAIHFNATAAYELTKGIYLGANGYYLAQITNAHENGTSIPNSKEEIGAIGPGLVVNRGKWFYFINGYHEVVASNTTAGNKLVLRVEKVF